MIEQWRAWFEEHVRKDMRFLEDMGYVLASIGVRKGHQVKALEAVYRAASPALEVEVSAVEAHEEPGHLIIGVSIVKQRFISWKNDQINLTWFLEKKKPHAKSEATLRREPPEKQLAYYAKVLQKDLVKVLRGEEWYEGLAYSPWDD